jgi:2-dehydropantoate 2-reductase
MRIAIFGSGGVGGYFGGRLAQAGEDVTFIARGEHLRAIQATGLRVDSLDGDFLINPARATDRVSEVDEVDLVILGVKAWQVPEAARTIKPIVGAETMVLPLQNGVDAVGELIAELGTTPVIGGLCKIVSFVIEPGHIRHAGFAPSVVIGELDNRHSHRIVALEETLNRGGLNPKIAGDIQVALWMKFLFIASFSGVGAIANAPAGVLRSEPELRARVLGAMSEIYELAHARNVMLPSDAIETAMASVDALPADATSSMQRDIAAGKPSELESQNGAVVRMARDAGIKVPIHESIYTALKPLEGH